MPSATRPQIPHYVPAPETNEPLDYADLAIIDLSKADTSEGRAELAKQVYGAMTTQGFFYVINHGLSAEETERMFDIGDTAFSQVSDEEKQQYAGTMKQTGSYQGYKLRQYWHVGNGVRDQVENYNINRDVTKRGHPDYLRPLLSEIAAFAKYNHLHILHPLMRLLALGLGLPEETLVDLHNFDAVGESYVRFMKYYPRTEEEEAQSDGVWLKGHTDFGSLTLLYSQPVSALQILATESDGSRKWKWIRHIDNALVVNAGDALQFLSGGRYKATIHRVIQPPVDQRQYTRLGVFYFAMTDDDVVLRPLPGLADNQDTAIGDASACPESHPTMEEWRKGRTSAYGQTELKKGAEAGVEEEYINGRLVKHYT
jgi:isopenicillin N synthase-like dioxygenase